MVCSPTTLVLTITLVLAGACTLIARLFYPDWQQLVGYFWYSIPGNSFAYLPHEPAVLYAGAV